jgi:PIN domain nuclease of toxin-antitoxin system
VIARAGRPVVKLVPVREQILPRKPGGWQGKVWMAPDFDDFDRHAFLPLPITFAHARAMRALPLHHRDPFDRMLVAQAQLEGLTLVTRDARLARYGVATLAA